MTAEPFDRGVGGGQASLGVAGPRLVPGKCEARGEGGGVELTAAPCLRHAILRAPQHAMSDGDDRGTDAVQRIVRDRAAHFVFRPGVVTTLSKDGESPDCVEPSNLREPRI